MFLNHGSFGACPSEVLAYQSELREQLESDPVRFFDRIYPDLLAHARTQLASFVGADPGDVAFVSNATAGVNTVLRSLQFEEGDELLTTNQEYAASRNALAFVAERAGASMVVADVPFPVASPNQIVSAVLSRVTDRTKILLIDHVASSTALVMPIAKIVRVLAERGIDTVVDGAHAPGMLDLDISTIGAAYYTGNCHKWLCAPKGAAFLWVRADRQHLIRPLSISNGASVAAGERSRFRLDFDWTGTADPSIMLCVPKAIDVVGNLVGGWPEVRRRNHALAVEAQAILCDALSISAPCPEELIGTMASLPLPDAAGDPPGYWQPDPLQKTLYDAHHIQVPVSPWPRWPHRLLRVSAQLYNTRQDYEWLAQKLTTSLRL